MSSVQNHQFDFKKFGHIISMKTYSRCLDCWWKERPSECKSSKRLFAVDQRKTKGRLGSAKQAILHQQRGFTFSHDKIKVLIENFIEY